MLTVEALHRILGLVPHPVEGGYFTETYRSADHIPAGGSPSGYGAARAASTAIYYLLTPDTFSAMHRLASDEIFHFYLGDPVDMLHLHPDGSHQVVALGPNLEAGQRPQVVVPRHTWQGARLIPGGQYALLGTTVALGFDYTDYETAPRAVLLASHPAAKDLILALTRQQAQTQKRRRRLYPGVDRTAASHRAIPPGGRGRRGAGVGLCPRPALSSTA